MNSSGYNMILYLIIGVAAMLLFAVSFLLVVVSAQRKKSQLQKSMSNLKEEQQNKLIEAAIRSEETERHRISETLHDEVGAILSSAKLHLLGIKEGTLDEKDKKLHQKGRELMNEVIQKVRGISHNLHSNVLKEFGLNEAIRHFIKKLTESTLISASTDLDENYESGNFETDISLYRIIQELTNNILKYANASTIKFSSVIANGRLQLVIYHDGNGLTQKEFEEFRYQKEGLGLKNIQNRIILLKGNIHFLNEANGSYIHIDVPVINP